MFREFLKDSFISGIVVGLMISAIAYYTFVNYQEIMEGTGILKIKLYPPRMQLIILALSLVLFRFMMVKWNRIKTGQGLFLTIFLTTILFFLNHRYKFF